LTKTLLPREQSNINQGLPVKKKALITVAFISTILISTVAGTILVKLVSANPLPPVASEITISSPQNATFTDDYILLNFTGQSNWNIYSYYYSVDGQSLKPVENITITSQEEANIGKNPSVNRTTVQGSCILQNLSKGWHNVTIYNIATEDFVWNFPLYQKGETMYQIEYSFRVQEEPLPTALIIFAIVAAINVSVGLLVYIKKRRRG
jgi:hypothetical protein